MIQKCNISKLVKLMKMLTLSYCLASFLIGLTGIFSYHLNDEVTTFKEIQPTFVAIISMKKHIWLKGNIF